MTKKILIVEDDLDIAKNLLDLLTSEGYEVDHASNGKMALDKMRNGEKPELILLDLMMPMMDGFQFRNEQESDPQLATIPVIIMTADGHIESKKLLIGAKASVRKPIDIDKLLVTLEKCLMT